MPARKAGRKGRRAEFDAIACLAWWREQQLVTPDEGLRGEHLRLQIRKLRNEVRASEGELVDAAEVDTRNAARTIAARERLLQLPGTAVQRGVPAGLEDLLTELVDQALLELASKGGYVEP